ncbi:MAG: hypothetical protein LLF94_04405 [Chlamydiales bacterium]|nr:hypothetical protein [Chlamydiales bacterium]
MTMPELDALKRFNTIDFKTEFTTTTLEVKPRGFLMMHFPRAVKWIRDTRVFAWLQESTFIGRFFPKVNASPLLAANQVERNITTILADSQLANNPDVQATIQKSIKISTNLLNHYASTTTPATKADGWMEIANNLQRFVPKKPETPANAEPAKPETAKPETTKPEEVKAQEPKEEETTPPPAPTPTNTVTEPDAPKTPEKKTDGQETAATTPATPTTTTTVATPDAPVKKTNRKQQQPRRRETTPVPTAPTRSKTTSSNPPATPKKTDKKK